MYRSAATSTQRAMTIMKDLFDGAYPGSLDQYNNGRLISREGPQWGIGFEAKDRATIKQLFTPGISADFINKISAAVVHQQNIGTELYPQVIINYIPEDEWTLEAQYFVDDELDPNLNDILKIHPGNVLHLLDKLITANVRLYNVFNENIY